MSAAVVLRLAGDVAGQFAHLPRRDAAAATAQHLRLFWDPQLRRQLLDVLERDPDRCPPVVRDAAALLLPAHASRD